MTTIRHDNQIQFTAPPEAVWELVAQTDKLNREMGIPPISFHFDPRKAGGTEAWATMEIAGFRVKYREHPFEWVVSKFHTVRRTFQKAPFTEIRGGVRLRPNIGGTLVEVWAEIDAANAISIPICQAIAFKSCGDFIKTARQFDLVLSGKSDNPYPKHSKKPPVTHDRLNQICDKLLVDTEYAEIIQRLKEYLVFAPPEDTIAIRPYELADRWGYARKEVLETCLRAARHGILDLRWRVLCPECRGAKEIKGKLSEITNTVHCKTCNIPFNADFDRSVEVFFQVAKSIRNVSDITYCVGGPGLSPHILAQWVIQPKEHRTVNVSLPSGRYQLRSLQVKNSADIVVSDFRGVATQVQLEILPGNPGGALKLLGSESVANEAEWIFDNGTDEVIVLRLEIPEWIAKAVTAAEVSAMQAFRDQFGSEVLSPGTEMAVRHVCLLFSDLKGSTALYRDQGDAPSYHVVREHFDLMQKIIARNGGAIVKTIGDAVMACFVDPAHAVRAAMEIQSEADSLKGGLAIKLGLHFGPAIAVNANEVLDYFGQTVNIAARLQRESRGSDLVMAASTLEDESVSEALKDYPVTQETFSANLRGVEPQMDLVRIQLNVKR